MTLDHRVPTATKGHFHSIFVSNIFCDPLFLLDTRCREKPCSDLVIGIKIGSVHSVHTQIFICVSCALRTAREAFKSISLQRRSYTYFFIGPYLLCDFIIAYHTALDN